MAWKLGPKDEVRLIDASKAPPCSNSPRSRAGCTKAERKGEGLFFMQTQAALKVEIRTPEQMFGDWKTPARARQAALPADAVERGRQAKTPSSWS